MSSRMEGKSGFWCWIWMQYCTKHPLPSPDGIDPWWIALRTRFDRYVADRVFPLKKDQS